MDLNFHELMLIFETQIFSDSLDIFGTDKITQIDQVIVSSYANILSQLAAI